MNQRREARSRTRRGLGGLSYRYVAGAVITILVVTFIAMNRDRTSILFILFTAETVLWVALTLAAVGGSSPGSFSAASDIGPRPVDPSPEHLRGCRC